MNALDLTPLFRSVVGFDRVAGWLDDSMNAEENSGYPPYNIERHSDERYRIIMALAGFRLDDLKIVLHEGVLTVQGANKAEKKEGVTYLHRGIAARSFKRRFQLSDSIRVVGAHLSDGLLFIDLKREIPDSMKPKEIKINAPAPHQHQKQLSHDKAAPEKKLIEGNAVKTSLSADKE